MFAQERLASLQTLVQRAALYVKRRAVTSLGMRLRENYHLDSPLVPPRTDVRRIGIHTEAQAYTRSSLMNEGTDVTYSFQRRYIYELRDATIDFLTGLVYDQRGKLIAESSAWQTNRLLCDIPQPRIRVPKYSLAGHFIFLATTSNLYHWLLEDLPVFLRALETSPQATVLYRPSAFRPLGDFLSLLGTHQLQTASGRVRVEKLTLVAKSGGLGNPFGHNVAHPEDLYFVEKWFREHVPATSQEQNQRVYLSRSRWKRATKEEPLLEAALSEAGFTVFHGDMSLFDQIALFSRATSIVGPAGSGLVNMLWMDTDSKVTELRDPGHRWAFYYDLAHMLGHDFSALDIPAGGWTAKSVEQTVAALQLGTRAR